MKIRRMQIKRTSKSKYIFIFGLVLALVASVLVVQAIRNYEQLVPVVVATADIEPFTVIGEQDVKIVNIPLTAAKGAGMYKATAAVVGRATRAFIAKGTPVVAASLATEADGSPLKGGKPLLSAKVTQLKNSKLGAFAVPMDSIAALGGEISPGDTVHVIGALNIPVGISKTAKEPVSKIIAPYAKVIQIITRSGGTAGVILALTPKQAQDIQMALLNGRVSLMLLPYEPDLNAGYTTTTTVQSFVAEYIQDSGTPLQ